MSIYYDLIWLKVTTIWFDMYVNGFTKLSTWIQWICQVGLYADLDSQDPNGLRWTALDIPSTGWDEGGWLCYDVWTGIVGDMCNVYGSVAFSYVLMHLKGQLNITTIGMIPERIFFIWFKPDLNKLLSQAIADGCQIKGPAVGHL